MRNLLILILPAVLGLGPAGCSVYKIDIQQGNSLETRQVNELEPGMSREQVVYLLGTPLIQDPFHPGRWDYVYSFKPGGGEPESQHLTLYFDNGRLARIDRSSFVDFNQIYAPTGSGRADTASQSTGGDRGPAPPRPSPGGGLPMP